MRALIFITGHVIYNPAYTYKFQLKTFLVCMGNSMACVARTEEKGRTDDAQPQICCNHRNKTVVTNNSGLRINLSKGKHANTYRYGELNFRCI